MAGCKAPPRFRYRQLGNLAIIGREAAVADFGRIRLAERVAWLLGRLGPLVHVLIGFRRLPGDLARSARWAYLAFEPGARLITGAGA